MIIIEIDWFVIVSVINKWAPLMFVESNYEQWNVDGRIQLRHVDVQFAHRRRTVWRFFFYQLNFQYFDVEALSFYKIAPSDLPYHMRFASLHISLKVGRASRDELIFLLLVAVQPDMLLTSLKWKTFRVCAVNEKWRVLLLSPPFCPLCSLRACKAHVKIRKAGIRGLLSRRSSLCRKY